MFPNLQSIAQVNPLDIQIIYFLSLQPSHKLIKAPVHSKIQNKPQQSAAKMKMLPPSLAYDMTNVLK